MLISALIDLIDSALGDSKNTLFSVADDYIPQVKRGVWDANSFLSKHGIQFAKGTYSFSTVTDTPTYALPTDFDSQIDLWNQTDDCFVENISDSRYRS